MGLSASDICRRADRNAAIAPIHIAAINPAIDCITHFLAVFPGAIRVQDALGRTVAHFAACAVNIGVIRLLSFHEADFAASDFVGVTPLMLAAKYGYCENAEAILSSPKKRILLQQKDRNGRSPIHYATHFGHIAVVRLFLEMGAERDAADLHGLSSIMEAARMGHMDCMQELCRRQDDLVVSDLNGRTVLHWAARNGHMDMARFLLGRKANANAVDVGGNTALHYAAFYGWRCCVRALLEIGHADIQHANSAGMTAFDVANWMGHSAIIKYLFEIAGDSVLFCDYNNRNVFHRLLLFKGLHTESLVVEALQKGKVDAVATDPFGNSCLLTLCKGAITPGDVSLATLLINSDKALVSRPNRMRETPISECFRQGNTALGMFLLHNGADLLSVTASGDNVLHCLISRPDTEANVPSLIDEMRKILSDASVSRLMVQLNLEGYSPALLAVKSVGRGIETGGRSLTRRIPKEDLLDRLSFLLEYFSEMPGFDACSSVADPTPWSGRCEPVASNQPFSGFTMLHLAAAFKMVDIAKLLVQLQHPNSVLDAQGRTPLMMAVIADCDEIVQLLLAANVKCIDVQDFRGLTALHHAVTLSAGSRCVRLLVSFDANVTIADRAGQTALHRLFCSRVCDATLDSSSSTVPARCSINKSDRSDADDPVEMISDLFVSERIMSCIDAVDANGNTALHYAAKLGAALSVVYLLHRKADFQCSNNDMVHCN